MSFLDELKRFLRTATYIARSHWNHQDNERNGAREVDLSGKDEVVAAVAEREYALAYPPNRQVASIQPFINTYSFTNILISFFGNFLFTASSAVLAIIASYFIMFGGLTGLGWQLALGEYAASLSWLGAAACTGLALGVSLRKLDRVVTMRKCLNSAEETLQDRALYHQERCLLEAQKIDADVERQLAEYRKLIALRKADIKLLNEMCENVEQIIDLEPERVESDLAPYRRSIKRLNEEVAGLNKQMGKVQQAADEVKAKIFQSQAMSAVIKASEALTGLVNGNLKAQIEQLNESAKETLALADNSVNNLNEELLVEAGLIVVDGDKPSKLLK